MKFRAFIDVLDEKTMLKVSLYTGFFVKLSFEPRLVGKYFDKYYLFDRRVLSIEVVENVLEVMLDCRRV